jgi:single-strand DNA-binding protein
MAGYNRIILTGNLTRDPQLSYTAGNLAVCKFGLANNRRWKDKDGTQREDTCFVDCTVFGQRAETFNQYMAKGRAVLIEGRLQYQQWETPEGNKRSKHEVVVDNFVFLGQGQGQGQGQGSGRSAEEGYPGQDYAPPASSPPLRAVPAVPSPFGPGYDAPPLPSGDDIPF